jgi:putative cardiolipin synthase
MKNLFLLITLLVALFNVPSWAQSTDASSTEEHRVKTLEYGAQALQLRLEMIERAERSIEIEYFIFDKSDAAHLVVEALLRKKRQNPNVRIRIIIDYFSLAKNLDPNYTIAMMDKGIEVKYYNNVFLLDLARVTHRTHRKLVIVDGREAITGGRNMADEYFDLKKKSNYLDRDIWVEGPIVQAMEESFNHFWDHPRRVKLPKKPSKPARLMNDRTGSDYRHAMRRYEEKLRTGVKFAQIFDPNDAEGARLIALREKVREIGQRQLALEPTFTVKSIRYISDGPDWKKADDRLSGRIYYEMLETAEKHIVMETPYFYLQDDEENVFKRIKEKGVHASLLLNSKRSSNEFAINYICLLEGLKFSRMGFDLYLFQGDWMSAGEVAKTENFEGTLWMQHSKTMLMDNHITWIGTLNMDPRSVQRLNAENAIVVDDEAFNARVMEHAMSRIGRSDHVVNGLNVKDGKNPAKSGGILEELRKLKTWPFYIFENQI